MTPYSVPNALMDILQVTVLVLVAAGATLVVRTRDRANGIRSAS